MRIHHAILKVKTVSPYTNAQGVLGSPLRQRRFMGIIVHAIQGIVNRNSRNCPSGAFHFLPNRFSVVARS